MLVNRSISDVLKPKSDSDIEKQLESVSNDFVNKITFKEFDETFSDINSYRKDSKKLTFKKEKSYLCTLETLYDIVNELSSKEFTGRLSDQGEYSFSFKYPEINHLLLTLEHDDKTTYYKLILKIIRKLSIKFNIEHE